MSREHTTVYRGLAILLVLACHVAGTFGRGMITFFTPLGGIGVSIFLLLSAYGLNESWNKLAKTNSGGGTRPYHRWWRKRFRAVWVPYILIQLVVYWPFHEFDLAAFALDVSLVRPLYHNGWYLQYLFLWYVVFYVVRRVRILDERRITVFTLASAITFCLLGEIQAEQSLSFVCGIVLSEKREFKRRLFEPLFGCALLGMGVVFLAMKQLPIVRVAPQPVMNLVQLGIKLPCGLGVISLVHRAMRDEPLRSLTFLGIISYELYLVHGYVLEAVPISAVGVVLFLFASVGGAWAYHSVLVRSDYHIYRQG